MTPRDTHLDAILRNLGAAYYHTTQGTAAQEFSRQMAGKGVTVYVHHIREARPEELPPAEQEDQPCGASSEPFGRGGCGEAPH